MSNAHMGIFMCWSRYTLCIYTYTYAYTCATQNACTRTHILTYTVTFAMRKDRYSYMDRYVHYGQHSDSYFPWPYFSPARPSWRGSCSARPIGGGASSAGLAPKDSRAIGQGHQPLMTMALHQRCDRIQDPIGPIPGPPVVPFYCFFFWGRVPLLK